MKKFSDYLTESYGKGGLTIFDIDDTLFHTTAKIAVVKDGNDDIVTGKQFRVSE